MIKYHKLCFDCVTCACTFIFFFVIRSQFALHPTRICTRVGLCLSNLDVLLLISRFWFHLLFPAMATSYSHQYQFRLEMRGHLITFYGKAMNFIFVTITQLSLMTSHRDDQKGKIILILAAMESGGCASQYSCVECAC
jgi:hypothetical protein